MDQIVKGQPVTTRGLSAPDRLQRAAARGFLPAHRLHEGRNEDGERRPQDHASPDVPGERDLRARAGLSRPLGGRERRVREAGDASKPRWQCSRKRPGLDVVDNPAKNEYPLPLFTSEKYNCAVGRLRKDCALDNGLCFWVSGDQLLKGAALNAVQIAEELLNG